MSNSSCTSESLQCQRRLSLRKLIRILRKIFTISENQTAFVDAEFGNDITGKLNRSARPFRTIQAAVNAIVAEDSVRALAWQVIIAPGVYLGVTTVPFNINLVGSGNNTILDQLVISGDSQVSNLKIVGPNLPLLQVSFSGRDVNGPVRLFNLNLNITSALSGQPVIKFEQLEGINGSVDLIQSSVIVNLEGVTSSDATNIILNSNGLVTNITDVDFDVSVSFQPKTVLIQVPDNRTTIQGGKSQILINRRAPEQNVIWFNAIGGFIVVQSHEAVGLEAIIGLGAAKTAKTAKTAKREIQYAPRAKLNADGGNVIFANAAQAGLIKISDVAIDFSSVPVFTKFLANVADQSSRVTILSAKTFSTFVFPVSGVVGNISYFAISEQANLVTSGGFYANIVIVNRELVGGDFYPVQDNDYTILVSDEPVNVGLADPAIASESVIYKGKIVVVKNISSQSMHVVSQNNTIFDGDQTLAPGEYLSFQNNGTQWFVI